MSDGYNGWKNYETWCVNRWLGNDPGTDSMVAEACDEIASNIDDERDRRYELADRLEALVGEIAEMEVPGLFASGSFVLDLYTSSISKVDWYEIADARLADWKESQSIDA